MILDGFGAVLERVWEAFGRIWEGFGETLEGFEALGGFEPLGVSKRYAVLCHAALRCAEMPCSSVLCCVVRKSEEKLGRETRKRDSEDKLGRANRKRNSEEKLGRETQKSCAVLCCAVLCSVLLCCDMLRGAVL